MSSSIPAPRFARSRLAIAGTMAVLILVMAGLAGRHLTLGEQVIELHGYLGNAVFVLAVVNVVLVVTGDRPGREFALAVAIVVLTFAQVGLGYVGRETAEAAAWHIPNGVLLMALSGYQIAESRNGRGQTPTVTQEVVPVSAGRARESSAATHPSPGGPEGAGPS